MLMHCSCTHYRQLMMYAKFEVYDPTVSDALHKRTFLDENTVSRYSQMVEQSTLQGEHGIKLCPEQGH